MLNRFEPNVNATIAFIRRLGVKVNNTTVDYDMQHHPDWPSVLCVSDSLNKWNIPNGVSKIDNRARIAEIPTPFIAFTKDRKNPMAIVTEVTDNGIRKLQGNYYAKPELVSEDAFLRTWDGTFLFAEPNEQSGEPNYNLTKRNRLLKALIPAIAVSLMIGIFFWILSSHIHSASVENTNVGLGIYLLFLTTVIGVGVSIMLLWYEIDENNALLRSVCTGIIKGNCGAVLTGKASKVFSWLSWSEVGFFYYTGALLSLVFAGAEIRNVASLIGLLNVMALAFPFYSVYYQWRVAKEWCILCLTVQGLLVLGSVIVFSLDLIDWKLFTIPFLTASFFLYALPVSVWYMVKPYILKLQKAKLTDREYLRLKFNTEIFGTLLKKQKQVDTALLEGIGIEIGKSEAKNTIIKVCNPYCGPCAQAHPKIEKLVSENPELVKVKMVFAVTSDAQDTRAEVVRHFLALAENNDGHLVSKALDDWYLADQKDYKAFAAKYPVNGGKEKQTEQISRMEEWCWSNKVSATPTLFVNGYEFPEVYDIDDLQYFLLE
jgi:protein-disulfide isomerase/uncharacterized membrane protein